MMLKARLGRRVLTAAIFSRTAVDMTPNSTLVARSSSADSLSCHPILWIQQPRQQRQMVERRGKPKQQRWRRQVLRQCHRACALKSTPRCKLKAGSDGCARGQLQLHSTATTTSSRVL